MNILTEEKRVAVVAALVEGNSIRATVRMTGVAKKTVLKLLVDLGNACKEYQDKAFQNLQCKVLQVDEIWSFVGMKEKTAARHYFHGRIGVGDAWTFTAIDAESKLVPHWHVGQRDAKNATTFIKGLAPRLAHRVQLTSDGLKAYITAVDKAFGNDIDFSQLVKIYGPSLGPNGKYSPSECVGTTVEKYKGKPKEGLISTSFVERQNLTMRMSMRRFTRLTNAFSKKIENLECAIALHFMYYNFVRIHQTLRCSPAMRAGITDRLWSIKDIVGLLDAKSK
ncbi:MAG: IS1 family transposase [Elusimicrobiota bacterium]|jgi:IS1 family transposase